MKPPSRACVLLLACVVAGVVVKEVCKSLSCVLLRKVLRMCAGEVRRYAFADCERFTL